jgi:hypothetical protein
MNTTSTSSLTQHWFVATDEHGADLLVSRWVSESARADAAGIA